jgi:hypothetical protein
MIVRVFETCYTMPRGDGLPRRALEVSSTPGHLQHALARSNERVGSLALITFVRAARSKVLPPPFPNVFFLSVLLSLVQHPLKLVTTSSRLNEIQQRTDWPTSLEHILPYGPEGTMRGLLWWFRLNLDNACLSYIIPMLYTIQRITGPLTLPFLVSSHIWISRGVLSAFGNASHALEADAERRTKDSSLETTLSGLTDCSKATTDIVLGCDRVQRKEMLRESAVLLLDALVRALNAMCNLSHCAGLVKTEAFMEANGDPQRLGQMMRMDFPHIVTPSACKFTNVAFSATYSSTWCQTLATVCYLREWSRCASPECAKTFCDAWPLKRCGGCRIITYCSRRCQTNAWNHPIVPHRRICATLRYACLNYRLDKGHFGRRAAERGEPRGFKDVVGHLIVDFFEDQTRYEIATSCEWPGFYTIRLVLTDTTAIYRPLK